MNRSRTYLTGGSSRHSSPYRLLTGLCPLALALLTVLVSPARADDSALASVTSQTAPDSGVPAILQYAGTPEGQAQAKTPPAPAHHAATGWQTQKDETIRKLREALATEKARNADTSQQQALAVQLKTLQAQLDTTKQQLTTALQARDTAQQQLQDGNQRINALEAQVKAGNSSDTRQQQALTAQMKTLQTQLATAQQQLKAASDQQASQTQQLTAQAQQLKARDTRIHALETQAQLDHQALTAGQTKLAALSRDLKTARTDATTQGEKEVAQRNALQSALTAAQQQLSTQTQQLTTAQQQMKTQTQQLADRQALADKVTSLEQDARQMADSLKAKTDALADLTAQVDTLKQHQTAAKPVPDLSSPAAQEAYSVGVSLGNDAVQELTTRQQQGVSMDRNTVLNGIEDTFAGKYRLDEAARTKALSSATQAVYKSLHDQEVKELAKGAKYQKAFAAKKGVKLTDGVYSLVDYAGQEKLTPDETVTVVMKESLTDGTVVSDMEAAGRQWTQVLKDYPPVFRGPLSRLGNHGSITIVVPADKAYGSKGRPPAIPPGATMVYNVRVVDARAPGATG
ncbi:TPA: FKBP-type peptidyl-prolyl cis-trans isomerase [Klebsiella aerogenes]|nr:FKBP-type peptidyl-prolyl cis-trans isomerase [Klebsiella aerogenes]